MKTELFDECKWISRQKRGFLLVSGILFFSLVGFAQDGLVGYWSFNEVEEGVVKDHTGNNNHGTLAGPELIPGVRGKALNFDGVNDYVVLGDDQFNPPGVLKDLGQGSISLWFKVEHIPSEDGIAPLFYYGSATKCDFFDAANQGLILEVGHSPVQYRSERLYFTIWKNGCTYPSFCFDSNDAMEENRWYHFVAVVGPDYNTGYLNGKEITHRRYNFGNQSYSQFFEDAVKHERLWLGKGHWDRTVQYLKGAIDELMIFNRPLNAEEVKAIYSDTILAITSPASSPEPGETMKWFPNPVSGELQYELGIKPEHPMRIKIIDSSGKVIMQRNIAFAKGTLDISHVTAGLYTIVLEHDNGRKEEHLVVL